MRKLGTIDLEMLNLAIKENGTFNENNLENSELKKHGVGKILDTLASLKDRKFISLNTDGSFSITPLAREILWNNKIPTWARILRLLQIKSCNLKQIIDTIGGTEEKIIQEMDKLRRSQLILMSPQRIENKVVRNYEILSEGVQVIDKTEIIGFDQLKFGETKVMGEILKISDSIIEKIQNLQIDKNEKASIIEQINELKNKLEI
tara:strand:- start:342 stop:956 length:615 start_codon:yes stop_codon:yes gene_type:complete